MFLREGRVKLVWKSEEKLRESKILSSPCLHAILYGVRGCQVASKYLLI